VYSKIIFGGGRSLWDNGITRNIKIGKNGTHENTINRLGLEIEERGGRIM